jgi:hypothetical protein
MPTGYELIASATAGSGGVSSFDFTSIPSTYTDLLVKLSGRSSRSAIFDSVKATMNSNTSSYTNRYLEGSGSSAVSGTLYTTSFFLGECVGSTATSNTFGSLDWYIPNYRSSNNKSASTDAVSENNATTAYAALVANLWSNTTAVTSLSLFPDVGNWTQYSTAYLYGIKNS